MNPGAYGGVQIFGPAIKQGWTYSPAAGRHNLARVSIVYFLVDYICEDHQYGEKVYWTSVSIEQC